VLWGLCVAECFSGMDAFLESFKEIMENLQQNTESVQKTMSNEQSTRERYDVM